MKNWVIVAFALVAAAALPAAAQSHASVTVSGNHSHSAVIPGPQTNRVLPPVTNGIVRDGTIIVFGFGAPGSYGHVHSHYCQFVPGHYEQRVDQIWVPEHWEQQYFPPRYEPRVVNGRRMRTLVEPGGYRPVWIEGHYQTRTTDVWVPGGWSCGY